jgi:hypothetical protein
MAGDVVDADTASEDEIRGALGVGEPKDNEGEPEQGDEGQEPSKLEDLPDWAQQEIKNLRREAANQRVKAREKARKAQTQTPAVEPKDLTAAEERGRESARLEYGIRLAGAEVKAALAGVVPDDKITEIVDELNLARYVGDDGEVDEDAIKVLRDRYTALLGTKRTPRVSHGKTGTAPSTKTTADQFADTLTSML